MRRELLIALAVALALGAGLASSMRRGSAAPAPASAAAPDDDGDAVASELEAAVAEQFALQDRLIATKGAEPGAAAGEASAAKLAALIARMDERLSRPVKETDLPLPASPHVSLAILSLDGTGPWEVARCRGNLAALLAYRYRLLRSRRAGGALRAEAARHVEDERAALAKAESERRAAEGR